MSFLKKGTIESFIAFFLSPVLSIPLIGLQLKRNDRNVVFLLSIFVGIISYLFIPNVLDDKAKYFERYNTFGSFSFSSFLEHLVITKRPDFIFEGLLFLFSKLGISIHILFFVVTAFSVYVIINFILDFSDSKLQFWKQVLLALLTFSCIGVFSGIRFYLATVFFLIALRSFLNKGNLVTVYFWILLAFQTHFSFLVFSIIPIVLHFKLVRRIKLIFVVSLVFLLLPKSILESVLSVFSFGESYSNKMSTYLEDDVFEFTSNGILLNNIRNFWGYLAVLFLSIYKVKFKDNLYYITLSIGVVLNIVSSISLVYDRYVIIFKIFFVILLIRENLYRKLIGKLFVILLVISFLIDIYVLRNSFYLILNSLGLTILSVISYSFNESDFLTY